MLKNPGSGGDPLLLDSVRYENAARETLSVTRLSYLLSGFAIERGDGVWVEVANQFAWMDAAKRRTVIRLDGVPGGKYRALRFHIGPDATANAATHKPALPVTANSAVNTIARTPKRFRTGLAKPSSTNASNF